jgi:hypothetical protein
VERLRAVTKRSVFSAMGETTAVGKVTEESVRLQRVIPMVGNSFKPFFVGRFESRDGKVILAGRFTMLPLVKGFMTVWFAFIAMSAFGVIFGNRPRGANSVAFELQPLVMLGFGVALVAIGKWFARNDTAWLSHLIEGALSSAAGGCVATSVRSEADEGTVPTVLKITAFVLAASGVMELLSGLAVSGLSGGMMVPPGMPQVPTLGRWCFVYSALMMALALGVWRRRLWAWQGVFAVLILSGCWSVHWMYSMQAELRPPAILKVIFAVLSWSVIALWGRWWYAQRKYFVG